MQKIEKICSRLSVDIAIVRLVCILLQNLPKVATVYKGKKGNSLSLHADFIARKIGGGQKRTATVNVIFSPFKSTL